jgi:ABC-type amino acid transport substrate-binding protein
MRTPVVRLAAVLAACVMVSPHPTVASNRDALVLFGDQDYPPITYLEDGTPAGLDVDVAAAISKTLGREVRVVLMDWDTAQQRVLRGQADGLLSLSVSADRSALFDFTESTATHEFGIFVPRGAVAIRGIGDLAGKRVGVTRGGLPRRVLESDPEVNLVFIRNYEEGFDQLTAGALDAVAADRWVGSYTLERRDVPNMVMAGAAFASAASGIAVTRGNTEVLDEINQAIREIKANGTLAEIQDRWGPQEMLFVSRQRIDRIMLSVLAGEFARLTVTDTGHGMTPEVQAQIFTPFFTTKGPSTGTGLGLATVQGIVEQSGGWIEVESTIGKGTRLSIHLPRLAASPALRSAGNVTATPPAIATGTILFVEADESIRALGMRTLRKQGFTVLGARHAAEALQLADQHTSFIDLLLTDIVMPGISGRELAERLTETRPDLKVLYTSGYTDDVVAIHDIGVNGPGFIPKPYSPDSLARRVRAILTGA